MRNVLLDFVAFTSLGFFTGGFLMLSYVHRVFYLIRKNDDWIYLRKGPK